jgi:hypothetical protein
VTGAHLTLDGIDIASTRSRNPAIPIFYGASFLLGHRWFDGLIGAAKLLAVVGALRLAGRRVRARRRLDADPTSVQEQPCIDAHGGVRWTAGEDHIYFRSYDSEFMDDCGRIECERSNAGRQRGTTDLTHLHANGHVRHIAGKL